LLERELELLRRRDAERTAELAARERRIRLLEEALRILQADRYGASREKLHVAPGQTELFNEAETIAELNEVLGTEVSLKATPQREDKSGGTKPGRKAIAAHLPRVAIIHDLAKDDRHCACGSHSYPFSTAFNRLSASPITPFDFASAPSFPPRSYPPPLPRHRYRRRA
jgi:transposase